MVEGQRRASTAAVSAPAWRGCAGVLLIGVPAVTAVSLLGGAQVGQGVTWMVSAELWFHTCGAVGTLGRWARWE